MKHWFVIFFLFFAVSCVAENSVGEQNTIAVFVTVEADIATETPIACSPTSDIDVMITTQGQLLNFELAGLMPSQTLTFVLSAREANQAVTIESNPIQPVTADGTFTYTETLGRYTNDYKQWQVQIIHSQGVICTDITFP